MGPEHDDGRSSSSHGVDQGRWRHPCAEHPAGRASLSQRSGQRLKRQTVLLLIGAGQQDASPRDSRCWSWYGTEHFRAGTREQVLDIHQTPRDQVPLADADQYRPQDVVPCGHDVIRLNGAL
jgi:hypothetical protein